jgi:hypothetical protein
MHHYSLSEISSDSLEDFSTEITKKFDLSSNASYLHSEGPWIESRREDILT